MLLAAPSSRWGTTSARWARSRLLSSSVTALWEFRRHAWRQQKPGDASHTDTAPTSGGATPSLWASLRSVDPQQVASQQQWEAPCPQEVLRSAVPFAQVAQHAEHTVGPIVGQVTWCGVVPLSMWMMELIDLSCPLKRPFLATIPWQTFPDQETVQNLLRTTPKETLERTLLPLARVGEIVSLMGTVDGRESRGAPILIVEKMERVSAQAETPPLPTLSLEEALSTSKVQDQGSLGSMFHQLGVFGQSEGTVDPKNGRVFCMVANHLLLRENPDILRLAGENDILKTYMDIQLRYAGQLNMFTFLRSLIRRVSTSTDSKVLENLTMDGTFERMVVLADRSLYRSDVARPVFECLDMWLGALVGRENMRASVQAVLRTSDLMQLVHRVLDGPLLDPMVVSSMVSIMHTVLDFEPRVADPHILNLDLVVLLARSVYMFKGVNDVDVDLMYSALNGVIRRMNHMQSTLLGASYSSSPGVPLGTPIGQPELSHLVFESALYLLDGCAFSEMLRMPALRLCALLLQEHEWALARERERMPSEGMFHQPAPVRLRRITMKLLRLFQQWCAQEVEFRHRVAESSKGESLPKKSPFPLPAQEIMTDTLSSFLERTLSDLEWDKEPETGLTVDNKLEPIDISLAMSSLLSLVDFHWNPSNGDVVAQKLAHRQTATRKWDSAVVEDSVLKNRFPSSRKALASAWQCIAALCRVPPAYSLRERDSSSLRHASHFLQEFCSLGGLQVSLEIMRVENLPAELYNPLFELWCRYIYTDSSAPQYNLLEPEVFDVLNYCVVRHLSDHRVEPDPVLVLAFSASQWVSIPRDRLMRILLTSLVLNSSPGVPSPGSPRFHLALCCVFFNMLIGVQGFQSHGGRKLFDALDRLAFLHEFDITAQESSELATAIYFRNQYSGEIDMNSGEAFVKSKCHELVQQYVQSVQDCPSYAAALFALLQFLSTLDQNVSRSYATIRVAADDGLPLERKEAIHHVLNGVELHEGMIDDDNQVEEIFAPKPTAPIVERPLRPQYGGSQHRFPQKVWPMMHQPAK